MPRYKDHQNFFNVVPDGGRSEYRSYGAFPNDEEGLQAALDHKERMEEQFPNVSLKISEE